SRDGSKAWGPPETPLLDPKQFTTYPTRLRLLRDGRLIVTGGLMRLPACTLPENVNRPPIEPLLMISEDGGKTWNQPVPVVRHQGHRRHHRSRQNLARTPGRPPQRLLSAQPARRRRPNLHLLPHRRRRRLRRGGSVDSDGYV